VNVWEAAGASVHVYRAGKVLLAGNKDGDGILGGLMM